MIELVVLLAVVFAGLVVAGALVGTFSLLFFVLTLPFRLLGWLLHGVGVLLALPFLAIAGIVAVVALGAAAVAILIPVLPIALLALGIVWLVRGGRKPARAT